MMAAALDDLSFELFECKVCFESILDKNPRTLSCNHTFCQPCLEQLHKQNLDEIQCPICRKVTVLVHRDVSKLASNFDLLKMKEHETTLLKKAKYLCDICIQQDKYNKGTARCKDCNCILCDECRTSHLETPVFATHKVEEYYPSKLCSVHHNPIKFICLTCLKKMCIICCFDQVHHKHKDRIHSLEKAGEIIKQECADFRSSLGGKLLELSEQKENLFSYLSDQERQLFHMYTSFASECGEQFNTVAQKFHRESRNIEDKIKTETKLLLQKMNKTESNICDDQIENDLSSLKLKQELHSSVNTINQIIQDASSINYSLFINQFDNYLLKKVWTMKTTVNKFNLNIMQNQHSAFHNVAGKCVRKLARGDLEIRKPVGLIQQFNHSILLSDISWMNVKHLDSTGQLISTYYPLEKEKCLSVSLWNDLLYVSTCSGVSVITLSDVERSRSILKSVKCGTALHSILAFDRMSFYIAFHDTGCVMKVTSKDEAQTVITGLNGPYFMTLAKTPTANYVLLTERGRKSINIYDENLKPLYYITGPNEDDQLDYPRDLCMTECNTVLVADAGNHRVSEYDLKGRFISHVLTEEEHGISWPCAISYRKPYLWITELDKANNVNSAQVKLFKFE